MLLPSSKVSSDFKMQNVVKIQDKVKQREGRQGGFFPCIDCVDVNESHLHVQV